MANPGTSTEARADALFVQYQREVHSRTDRLFAGLMGFQWIAGIVLAAWLTPATSRSASGLDPNVWDAIVLGGLISLFPASLAMTRPGRTSTRHTIAVAQMLMSALLIHLTGGRLETHVHIFVSLAFLAFYRDWRVLIPATLVVALDHALRGIFWPQSMFGVFAAGEWRWLEHAAWVIFEDVFLIVSCRRGVAEMRDRAERTAALEQELRMRQQAETDARSLASLTAAVGLAVTRRSELRMMLQRCAEALVKDLDGGLAQIWTLNEPCQLLELNASAGAYTRLDGVHSRVGVGSFTIGGIARDRTPCIASADAVDPPLDDPHWVQHAGMVAFAGYPLLVETRLLGVMAIFARRQFSPAALETMAAIADGVAVGIERKHAEAALARHTRDLQEAHDRQRRNAQQLAALVDQLRVAQRAEIPKTTDPADSKVNAA